MSVEMPEGWQDVSLEDCLYDLRNGWTYDTRATNGTLPITRIETISNGQIDYARVGYATADDRIEAFRLHENDILFSHINSVEHIGKVAIKSDARQLYHGMNLMRLRPNERVVPSFLFALLQSDKTRAYYRAACKRAVNQASLNKGEVSGYRFPLPLLDEQQRIAEVLRSMDEAVAANRSALDQIGRSRAAILRAAFDETVWESVPLGELGSWQSGGTPPKQDAAMWGGNIPWVCPRDVKAPLIRRTHSSITRLALRGSCKLAPMGTLMVVVRGMILAKAIPTAIVTMDAAFNQDMKAFQPNGRASPKFVQLCLQHQERQLLRVVNTATHGTKKLDTNTLLSVHVPLPDLETQQKLTDAVSDLDFVTVKYGEEHLRLSTIKNALSEELLSGRVRVPE